MSLFLLIMGVQGSGKGTQAAFIQEKYGIPQISTGDLFRAMRTRDDELARNIQEIMKAGKRVSDDQTNAVLHDRLQRPDVANGAIFDGYPRTVPQAQWLDQYLSSVGAKLNAVLLLNLDPYNAFKRAFGRVSLGKVGYNIYFNNDDLDWRFVEHEEKKFPPRLEAKLKSTGEALEHRADDANPNAIISRIDDYLQTTRDLIPYYRERKLVHDIDAGRSIEDVWTDIERLIEALKS